MPLLPPLITHMPNAQQLYLSAGGVTPNVPTITAEEFVSTGTGAVSGFIVTTSGGNNFVADCNPSPAITPALTINREGIPRWAISTFVDETGGNAGSDLFIQAYSDAGVAIGSGYINIQRSSGDVGINGGDLFVTTGNFVGAGASITKSATQCVVQPTDITKMMTINAAKPFVAFVGVVGENSWNFQPALGMFNSLVSYIDVNGLSIANVGSIQAQDPVVLSQ